MHMTTPLSYYAVTAPAPLPVSVLIVDHHPLVHAGLAVMIASMPRLVLAGQATDADSACAAFAQRLPDVVLVDLRIPGGGLVAIGRIRAAHPHARIVVLTESQREDDIYRALLAGAAGYLLKTSSFEELAACIDHVNAGRNYLPPELAAKLEGRIKGNQLSPRELEILHYVSSGKSNKVIARVAGIDVGTVKYHVNNILAKLNVSCRTEAANVARKRGLVQLA